MNAAVRDCLVSGYEPLVAALELPDPGDRHVLAAAIRTKAQIIVTRNLKDFPAEQLAPWELKAKSGGFGHHPAYELNSHRILYTYSPRVD